MKTLRRLAVGMLVMVLTTACAAPAIAPTTVNVASLKGPTTMGLVKLMDDASSGTASLDYQVEVYGTADEVVARLVQGDVDIALLPANLAAVVYQRTEGTDAQIAVLAVNTLGVLSVVEAGGTVQSVADLEGRTVYSTGRGTTPQYVLEYVLGIHGLTAGVDLTVEYLSEATEVASKISTDPGALGVLPQPYVSVVESAMPQVRTALNLTDEWAAGSPDSMLVTSVVVVRTAFAAEHPDAVAQFQADYEASTEFTNDHPTEAAPMIVNAGIVPNTAVGEAAIPECNIVYIAGDAMRAALGGYLDVLFAADPASVGGSVPGDAFYYGDE
jgi:NitT/TauT family transport system substrate-binding protein